MNFRKKLADDVMGGRKTATRRPLSEKPKSPWHRDSKRWPVGKVFAVCPGRAKPNIGHARVVRSGIVRLGHLTEAEARAESFATVAEFEATWRELHDGKYDPDAEVWCVEFEVVPAEVIAPC